MSRIGKQEINIPAGVSVTLENGLLIVKGSKGEIQRTLREEVRIKIADGKITSEPVRKSKFSNALWGTYMSHIKNMIQGVENEYEKKLLIEGVGYKWEVKGTDLYLNIGFSHQVILKIPKGLTIVADKTSLTIKGVDKEMVSGFAMEVRRTKMGEPYKGKGIRYSVEVLRRKQGKKSA